MLQLFRRVMAATVKLYSPQQIAAGRCQRQIGRLSPEQPLGGQSVWLDYGCGNMCREPCANRRRMPNTLVGLGQTVPSL